MPKIASYKVEKKDRIILSALNEKQKEALESISKNKITILYGSAGTGKTFLPVIWGLKELLEHKRFSKIILTRPCVEAFGEALGFLPGTMYEKVSPHLMPIFEILSDFLDESIFKKMISEKIIQIIPLAYMRGANFNRSFAILDEAENTIPEQMKLFLTRLGKDSKMVISGDPNQVDRRGNGSNGLTDAIKRLEGIEGIKSIYFDKTCIVRDPIIAKIEEAYENNK